MGYLRIDRSELECSVYNRVPSRFISQNEHNKRVLKASKRYYDRILHAMAGVHTREVFQQDFSIDKLSCPNTHIIRKYIPALRKVVDIPVPCGHCLYCLHKKQNKLIYRLYNHARVYNHYIYVTLTYSDSHYIDDIEVARQDITKFLKRFRKEFGDRTFSYYMVCERGDLRNRLHFHLLIFWNGLSSVDYVCNLVRDKWKAPIRNLKSFDEFFEFCSDGHIPVAPIGHVYIDDCCSAGTQSTAIASYISKYVSDGSKKQMFRSWSLGLGADILSVDFDLVHKMMYLRCITYIPKDKAYTISVPEYYKNKLFSQSERDVFFADYLVSDEYKHYLMRVRDPVWQSNLYDIYSRYEERCKNAYRLKLKHKAEKLKLL